MAHLSAGWGNTGPRWGTRHKKAEVTIWCMHSWCAWSHWYSCCGSVSRRPTVHHLFLVWYEPRVIMFFWWSRLYQINMENNFCWLVDLRPTNRNLFSRHKKLHELSKRKNPKTFSTFGPQTLNIHIDLPPSWAATLLQWHTLFVVGHLLLCGRCCCDTDVVV